MVGVFFGHALGCPKLKQLIDFVDNFMSRTTPKRIRKERKPRNWAAVKAILKTSAGPMDKKGRKNEQEAALIKEGIVDTENQTEDDKEDKGKD